MFKGIFITLFSIICINVLVIGTQTGLINFKQEGLKADSGLECIPLSEQEQKLNIDRSEVDFNDCG